MLAGEKGAIEATVKTIDSNIDSTDLCLVGCNILISMMAHNGKVSHVSPGNVSFMLLFNKAENQARAGAVSAIETMIKLINTHLSNPSVCELGLIALWNMTFNSKTQSHCCLLSK